MNLCSKTIFILLLASQFCHLTAQDASHIISFFMRPYPYIGTEKEVTQEYADKKSKKLHRPEKIAQYTLRSVLESNTASGIFCTYKGQLSFSDPHGQVNFVRRQEEPNMQLLITSRINPILEQQQVINHWELEVGTPAALFSVSLEEDIATEVTYWKVEQIDPIPDKTIDLNTVIVFAKPSHIFVPEGITVTKRNPQLILPDIYVKKNIDKLTNAFYLLDLKRFFRHNRRMYELKNEKILKQIY